MKTRLIIIHALHDAKEPLRTKQIWRRANLARSTAVLALEGLQSAGLVSKHREAKGECSWRLTPFVDAIRGLK